MALKPKSAVFQVRIDPELYERFKSFCDSQNITVSDFVRRTILANVERAEERERRKEYVQSPLERKSST